MSVALVEDIHAAVLKALAQGTTLAGFRKDFDRIVAAHGWEYNGTRNWRSRVIYDTNLRTARAAGKWAQAKRLEDRRPYLRYVAQLDDRTRPLHRRWHGIILPVSHPWWRTHMPPNGWYCRCDVESVSDADLARYGWSVSVEAPTIEMESRTVTLADGTLETWWTPKGIDTGFGSNPGDGWLSGAVPPPLQQPLAAYDPAAPKPRPADLPVLPAPVPAERLLPQGWPDEDYIAAFLGEFGAAPGRPAAFRDAAGHLLAIGEDLFRDARTGGTKAAKRGRERYLLLLADAIKDPDEIWAQWEEHRGTGEMILKRVYVKALALPKGGGGVSVFAWTRGGWSGKTVFAQDGSGAYLDNQRFGALLYRRGE